MRASQWLLGLATTSAIVASIASGCGGSSNSGGPSDSGTADVTTDHVEAAAQEAAPPDTSGDVTDAACVPDVQITSIPVPEGGVPGSDASAAVCLSCVMTACPMLISQCNATCGCPEAFITFEGCVAAGGSLLSCAQALATTAGLPLQDFTCAASCANSCGVTLPTDGGKDSTTDSPTDTGSSDATGQ